VATGKKKEEAKKEQKGDDELKDDLVSPLTIETYIERRVRPFTDYLEDRALRVAYKANALDGLSIVANTSGAVIAVLKYDNWLALTVSVAAVAAAIADYYYVNSQLNATNKALDQCHKLLIWWDCLSLVQRKTRQVKKKCAETCEVAILSLVEAETQMSAALPNELDTPEEE